MKGAKERDEPPGIMRSAPVVSFGITAEGVLRKGRRVGCFHNAYTDMLE